MSLSFSTAFGAVASNELVTRTLDALNSAGPSGSSEHAAFDKQTAGAAVVSKTLDSMNSGSGSSPANDMSQTYNFSKDVLGAYATGIGSLADVSA